MKRIQTVERVSLVKFVQLQVRSGPGHCLPLPSYNFIILIASFESFKQIPVVGKSCESAIAHRLGWVTKRVNKCNISWKSSDFFRSNSLLGAGHLFVHQKFLVGCVDFVSTQFIFDFLFLCLRSTETIFQRSFRLLTFFPNSVDLQRPTTHCYLNLIPQKNNRVDKVVYFQWPIEVEAHSPPGNGDWYWIMIYLLHVEGRIEIEKQKDACQTDSARITPAAEWPSITHVLL